MREGELKAAGAHGVLISGNVVQVVVGPEADSLTDDIRDLLEQPLERAPRSHFGTFVSFGSPVPG